MGDNLHSNAAKYSDSGKHVTLTAWISGRNAEILVQDEGRGITKVDMPKLSKGFGKTSARPTAGEEGTGLWLDICKRIVEAHGQASGRQAGREKIYRLRSLLPRTDLERHPKL